MPCNNLRKKELQSFEREAGIRFRRHDLLNLAFCHRSYTNEHQEQNDNNEKLEFLGDSILGLVVSDYLFNSLPDKVEGDLARIKSFVVSEESLAELAIPLNIDKYLLIGKGEENSGGRLKKAILADAMEAIFGAYFLDVGFKEAGRFILTLLIPQIDKVLENRHKRDFKTLLQEYCQKNFKTYPKYSVIKNSGPDHNKTFWIEVSVNTATYGPGMGKNKKEAEQKAAEEAYLRLNPED
ncbi:MULTISPECIES: ribonuclease III [unclassified Oceanispirochaeta]|uniref:ribonuclease III n=1 Tax=unclassified Oceanispirochaeta TaxID=2635722 RepID=UPI000E09232C|nr:MULTISPECIES: ribonuclease III [unclassified Oceanispirochaeta]MBF9016108.1 ribonuclease III [Oceanispirochaeta sp. M2]NPD72571.1 ribonuclease III [Oceanispirochaeta sp. M1]RDG32026.1 ribonuclease III [Oceanispirochaeta sp. M1]